MAAVQNYSPSGQCVPVMYANARARLGPCILMHREVLCESSCHIALGSSIRREAAKPGACVQVGEFAFVLLSLASQLGLISNRLSMLLLGVTAISLLTTPLVLSMAVHVLNPDGHAPTLPSTSAPVVRKGEACDSGSGVAVCEHFSSPVPEYDARGMLTSRSARPASERFDPDQADVSPVAFTLALPQRAVSRCSSHGDTTFFSPCRS